MSQVTLKGNPVTLSGSLPKVGSTAPNFKLIKTDLSEASLEDFKGKNVILNIFPSIDTGTCATSVREFNEKSASMDNTVVLCISKDLPFAHSRFCAAEGIEDVISLSSFRNHSFAKDYGVEILDGPLKGLNARAVVVIDEEGKVEYTELVPEITEEPTYEAALRAV